MNALVLVVYMLSSLVGQCFHVLVHSLATQTALVSCEHRLQHRIKTYLYSSSHCNKNMSVFQQSLQ